MRTRSIIGRKDEGKETVIVGAGAVGLQLASKLKDDRPIVVEEHSRIGKPVQCSGILTESINDVIKIDKDVILNKIKSFSIKINGEIRRGYAKKCSETVFNIKKQNIVVDREKFDLMIMERAKKNNAQILTKHRYLGNDSKKVKILDIEKKKEIFLKYANLVGCDGPFSPVGKHNQIYGNRELLSGLQFRAEMKNDIDKKNVDVFPTAGEFGWVLPESENVARIGIIAKKDGRKVLERFLKANGIKENIKKVMEWQSGVVPRFKPNIKVQSRNVFLAGDSAGMIKNTSYGGLYHGIKSANVLANCIENNRPEDYRWQLRRKVWSDLMLHSAIRKMMSNMDEKEWLRLIEKFNSKDLKAIIEKYDRDSPTNYIFRIALRRPSLLMLARHLL